MAALACPQGGRAGTVDPRFRAPPGGRLGGRGIDGLREPPLRLGEEQAVRAVQEVAHELLASPRGGVEQPGAHAGVLPADGVPEILCQEPFRADPMQDPEAALARDGGAGLRLKGRRRRAFRAGRPSSAAAAVERVRRETGPPGHDRRIARGRDVARELHLGVRGDQAQASGVPAGDDGGVQRDQPARLAHPVRGGVEGFGRVQREALRGVVPVLERAEAVQDVALAVPDVGGLGEIAPETAAVAQGAVQRGPVQRHVADSRRPAAVERGEDVAAKLLAIRAQGLDRGEEGAGIAAAGGDQALRLGRVLHERARAEPVARLVLAQKLALGGAAHGRMGRQPAVDAMEQVARPLRARYRGGEVGVIPGVEHPALEGAAGAQLIGGVRDGVCASELEIILPHVGLQRGDPLRHRASGQRALVPVVDVLAILLQPEGYLLDQHGAEHVVGPVDAEHHDPDPVAADVRLVDLQVPVGRKVPAPQGVGVREDPGLEVRGDRPRAVLVQVGCHGVLFRRGVLRIPGQHGLERLLGGPDRRPVEAAEEPLVVHASLRVLLQLVVAQVVFERLAVEFARHPRARDEPPVVQLALEGDLAGVELLARGVALLDAVRVDVFAPAVPLVRVVHVAHLVRVEHAEHPRVDRSELGGRGVVLAAHLQAGIPLARGRIVEQGVHVAPPNGLVHVGVRQEDALGQRGPPDRPLQLRARRDADPALPLVELVDVLLQLEVVRVVAGRELDGLLGRRGDLAHDRPLRVGLDVLLVVEHLLQVETVEGPVLVALEQREQRRRAHRRRRGVEPRHVRRVHRVVHGLEHLRVAVAVRLAAAPRDHRLRLVSAGEQAVPQVGHGDAGAGLAPARREPVHPPPQLLVLGGHLLAARRGGEDALEFGVVHEGEHARPVDGLVHFGRPHEIQGLRYHARHQARRHRIRGIVVDRGGAIDVPDAPQGLAADGVQFDDPHPPIHVLDHVVQHGDGARPELLLHVVLVRVRELAGPVLVGDAVALGVLDQPALPVLLARLRVVPVPHDGPEQLRKPLALHDFAVGAYLPEQVLRAPRVAQVGAVGRSGEHPIADVLLRQLHGFDHLRRVLVVVRLVRRHRVPPHHEPQVCGEAVPRGRRAGGVRLDGMDAPRAERQAVLRLPRVGLHARPREHDALEEPVERELVEAVHERVVEARGRPYARTRGPDRVRLELRVQLVGARRQLQVLVQRLELRENAEQRAQPGQHLAPVGGRRLVGVGDFRAQLDDARLIQGEARCDDGLLAQKAVQREHVGVQPAPLPPRALHAKHAAHEGRARRVGRPLVAGRGVVGPVRLEVHPVDKKVRGVALADGTARHEGPRVPRGVQLLDLAHHPAQAQEARAQGRPLGHGGEAQARAIVVQPDELVVLERVVCQRVPEEVGAPAHLGRALHEVLQPLVIAVARGGPQVQEFGPSLAGRPPAGLVAVNLFQVRHHALRGIRQQRAVGLQDGAAALGVVGRVLEPVLEGAHAVRPQQVLRRVPPVGALEQRVGAGRRAARAARADREAELYRVPLKLEPILHGQHGGLACAYPRAHGVRVRAVAVHDALHEELVHAHPLAHPVCAAVGIQRARPRLVVGADPPPALVLDGAFRVQQARPQRVVLAQLVRLNAPRVGPRADFLPGAQVHHLVFRRRVRPRVLRRHVRHRADREARRLVSHLRLAGRVGPGQVPAGGGALPLGVPRAVRGVAGAARVQREVLRVVHGHPRAVSHVVGLRHGHPDVARPAQAPHAKVRVRQGRLPQQVVLIHQGVGRVVQRERLRKRAVGGVLRLARHRHVVADGEIPRLVPPVQHPVAELAVRAHGALRVPPEGPRLHVAHRVRVLPHPPQKRVAVQQRGGRVGAQGVHAVRPSDRHPRVQHGARIEAQPARLAQALNRREVQVELGLIAAALQAPARVVEHPVDAHQALGRDVHHAPAGGGRAGIAGLHILEERAREPGIRAGHGQRAVYVQRGAQVQQVQLSPAPPPPDAHDIPLGADGPLQLGQ